MFFFFTGLALLTEQQYKSTAQCLYFVKRVILFLIFYIFLIAHAKIILYCN